MHCCVHLGKMYWPAHHTPYSVEKIFGFIWKCLIFTNLNFPPLHQNIFFSRNLPNPLKDWKCFIRNFHQNKLNANTELNQLKFTFTISKAYSKQFTLFLQSRTQILLWDEVETLNPLTSPWTEGLFFKHCSWLCSFPTFNIEIWKVQKILTWMGHVRDTLR